jgi:predicted metal-binding protein
VADCRAFFDEYAAGLLIRLTVRADKDAYPAAWSKDMTRKLLEVERAVFLKGHPKTFLLNQTCCAACADCSGNRAGCKDKKASRPSPEALAVDVYRTAERAGLGIHVIAENPSEIHRVAILLVD